MRGAPCGASRRRPAAGEIRLIASPTVIPEMPEALFGIVANSGACRIPDCEPSGFRDDGRGSNRPEKVFHNLEDTCHIILRQSSGAVVLVGFAQAT